MTDFSPSDSDIVFRRKERFILLAVVGFEVLIFAGVFLAMVTQQGGKEAVPVGAIMVANLLFMGALTAFMWTYEVRITPYEFVVRHMFGTRVIPFSMVVGMERIKVQGKTPETFVLNLKLADGQKLRLPDVVNMERALHEELRARCKALLKPDEVQ